MEFFDICNESGQPTGEIVERSIAHRDGILHRTAHTWVVRSTDGKWQVLLQKRSLNKDSFPGLFDTSSAGHIPAGSEPLESALRELAEELGIYATADQLTFAGTFRIQYEEIFHDSLFRDNEYTTVYVYSEPVDINKLVLQESEVSEARWFDLDEVATGLKEDDPRFCMPPQGFAVLTRYLDTLRH